MLCSPYVLPCVAPSSPLADMKLSSSFFAKAAVAAATVGTSTIKASPLVTTTEDGSNVADAYFQMRAGSELIDERAQVSEICAAIASSNGSSDVSYDQPYRPQIHFSPSSGFMNDPNGLDITKNEQGKETVHMYYQYNPTQLVAGNQHWGTATSNGFETYAWQNHLPAIAPANSSEGIFSGSAVIDSNNTSGFFNESTYSGERVVAIYTLNTATEQTQNVSRIQLVQQHRKELTIASRTFFRSSPTRPMAVLASRSMRTTQFSPILESTRRNSGTPKSSGTQRPADGSWP